MILTKFENSLKQAHLEKDEALAKKEAAENEVRTVRKRYKNILGNDQFEKDYASFGNHK